MATVVLKLMDGGSITSTVIERFASDDEAKDRAEDLSRRMTDNDMDHRIECLSAERHLIPYRRADGAIVGPRVIHPEETVEFYCRDLDRWIEDYNNRNPE